MEGECPDQVLGGRRRRWSCSQKWAEARDLLSEEIEEIESQAKGDRQAIPRQEAKVEWRRDVCVCRVRASQQSIGTPSAIRPSFNLFLLSCERVKLLSL